MLNFDSTVNIATILALVAIVCPVLTAIIDNVFRRSAASVWFSAQIPVIKEKMPK